MYAPDASLAKDRDRMYKLRSNILHGSDLLEIDQIVPIQWWTPTGFKEDELYNGMWRVTRTALRNWLKSPPSPSEEETVSMPKLVSERIKKLREEIAT